MLLTVLVASNWVGISFQWSTPASQRGLFIGSGAIGGGIVYDDGEDRFYESSGVYIETGRTMTMPFRWWFGVGINQKLRYASGPKIAHLVVLPLWFPLLLIGLPTAWLWYIDRPIKSWQCAKCRYDLRGLEGGVCPECGISTGTEAGS